MRAGRTPQAVAIAGPNGAGKTSAAPDLLQDAVGIDAFANADVIAQSLAAFSPESAAFEAGRIMLGGLDELARALEHFAFESALAGRSAHRLLTGLAEGGYDVRIFYDAARSGPRAPRARPGPRDARERRGFPTGAGKPPVMTGPSTASTKEREEKQLQVRYGSVPRLRPWSGGIR